MPPAESPESSPLAPPALDADAALWSDAPAGRPLLVLLHGYGSDERDLFGLVPHLPPAFVYAAPRAPLTPPWPAPATRGTRSRVSTDATPRP